MPGVTLSFVADPALAARVRDIARSDGVTQSQAAARASAVGALLPASARRSLRFLLQDGGDQAQRDLAALLTRAIAQAANAAIERQLLAAAPTAAPESEEALAEQAVRAVADYRRDQAGRPKNR